MRSLGTQTIFEIQNIGDEDSLYNNSDDFDTHDDGMRRSRPLSITFLSAPGIEGSEDRKNAGVI